MSGGRGCYMYLVAAALLRVSGGEDKRQTHGGGAAHRELGNAGVGDLRGEVRNGAGGREAGWGWGWAGKRDKRVEYRPFTYHPRHKIIPRILKSKLLI